MNSEQRLGRMGWDGMGSAVSRERAGGDASRGAGGRGGSVKADGNFIF